MKSKKWIGSLAIAMACAAFLFYFTKNLLLPATGKLDYTTTADPHRSSSEEILDHALLVAQLLEGDLQTKYGLLKAIEKSYQGVNKPKKAARVQRLAKALHFIGDSYASGYWPLTPDEAAWNKDIKNLFCTGHFPEAAAAAENNPYALSQMGSVYLKKGQEKKADEIFTLAYEKIKTNPAYYLKGETLDRIVKGYFEINQDAKAWEILSSYSPEDDLTLMEMIELLNQKQKFNESLSLSGRLTDIAPLTNALIDIAQKSYSTAFKLNQEQRELLKRVSGSIRQKQIDPINLAAREERQRLREEARMTRKSGNNDFPPSHQDLCSDDTQWNDQ